MELKLIKNLDQRKAIKKLRAQQSKELKAKITGMAEAVSYSILVRAENERLSHEWVN